MERCSHREANWKRISESFWEFSCRECNLAGWGPSPDAAKKEFRKTDIEKKLEAIYGKKQRGETLSRKEEQIIAYSPKPFGTAAGCASCDSVIVLACGGEEEQARSWRR